MAKMYFFLSTTIYIAVLVYGYKVRNFQGTVQTSL